jgi:extradiol dioxygenase family protein
MRIYYNVSSEDFPHQLAKNTSFHPIELGYLDITAPPYNAAGDGVTDDTQAIRLAIKHGYENDLVVYFPLGTYLVSRQLKLVDTRWPGSSIDRKHVYALMGERSRGGRRPTIRLKDGAWVEEGILVDFEFRDDGDREYAASHYNAHFRGIDIDMGNNPKVSAISMNGAQYCVIEDVTISGNFRAGIHKLPGSGGSVTNVRVEGGEIGVLQDEYRPSPSLQGVVLTGQRSAAVKLTNSRGPIVLAGFHIESPENPMASWRALDAKNQSSWPIANVALVDGTIVDHGADMAISNAYQDFYMREVYVKAKTVIKSGKAEVLAGSYGRWTRVKEYFFASGKDASTAVVDGVELGQSHNDKIIIQDAEPQHNEPPSGLVEKHSWDEQAYPDCVQQDCILVTDYGATPNDRTDDDAPAIMAALQASLTGENAGKAVFLPRGVYHIGQTVHVPTGVQLVGTANSYSLLRMKVGWKPAGPTYALLTEDSASGELVLGDFTILGRQASPANGLESHKNITLIGLRSHGSLVRDVMLSREDQSDREGLRGWRKDAVFKAPMASLSGSLSGKIYNMAQDFGSSKLADPSYRTLLIEGVRGPLAMYQPDVEYGATDPQAEIANSENLFLYGFKFEKQNMLLRIRDSRNVAIIGGSGNYRLCGNDDRIIDVQNSSDILITNLGRQPQRCPSNEPEPRVYAWLRDQRVTAANTLNLGIFKKGNLEPREDNAVDGWQLNGAAAQAGGVLRLTPAVDRVAGSAFYITPLRLGAGDSFSARFDFRVHGGGDGGEGMTFVIQGKGPGSLGDSWNGLGYAGIGASLAVEIDNRKKWQGTDPDANHLAVLENGDVTDHRVVYTPAFGLEDGAVHTLWVDYDGAIATLAVYLAQAPGGAKPASPVLTYGVDLPALLGGEAYVGFTAATGARVNNHDVEGFTLVLDGAVFGNQAPVLTDPGDQGNVQGEGVSLQVVASDDDGDPLTFSAAGLPAGLTIDPATGLISGSVTAVGDYAVTVSVADGRGGADSVAFTWTVTASGAGEVIDYPDFGDVTGWQLNGAAAQAGGVLRLTPAVEKLAGSAFYTTPLSLGAGDSFSARFDFRMHGGGDGGEGMAFVIRGDGPDSLGGKWSSLGYTGTGASLAVEIDTRKKWQGTDLDGNHLAVLENGDVTDHRVFYTPAFGLEDGAVHTLWVDYDGASATLAVYLAPAPGGGKPASPVLTYGVDLPALLGGEAYVGFTAATGARVNNHDVLSWKLVTD